MRFFPVSYNSDFSRAYRRGKNIVHPQVVVYVNKNRVGHTRVGITASKKVGNAVARNRARRVLRHALAEVLSKNTGGVDIILVARGRTVHLKSWQLVKTLRQILPQAGVQVRPPHSGGAP